MRASSGEGSGGWSISLCWFAALTFLGGVGTRLTFSYANALLVADLGLPQVLSLLLLSVATLLLCIYAMRAALGAWRARIPGSVHVKARRETGLPREAASTAAPKTVAPMELQTVDSVPAEAAPPSPPAAALPIYSMKLGAERNAEGRADVDRVPLLRLARAEAIEKSVPAPPSIELGESRIKDRASQPEKGATPSLITRGLFQAPLPTTDPEKRQPP